MWLFWSMSQLNELNLKLQGRDSSVWDLITAVSSVQGKLEGFKENLQGQDQVQGERDASSCVDFVNELNVNFSKRFDSCSFRTHSSSQMSEGSQRKSHSTSSGHMLAVPRCN